MPQDVHLQVVPTVVYKVDDPGNSATSTFVFDLALICAADDVFTTASAVVELGHEHAVVERQQWTAEMLAKIRGARYQLRPDTPVASPRRMFTLPEAFDLRFYVRRPQALAIDSADVRLTIEDRKGGRTEQAIRVPIQSYQQKTTLTFPFRGHGHVGQDWGTNGGHGGGFFADFAVDVIGLDANYGPQTADDDQNASATGWGRQILAPAAGTVTYARNDVPDNTQQARPDLERFAALPEPVMAYLGNCVIIDHGNSEHSVLAHMQHGSITVTAGERVAGGQVIGLLGNSGDSSGPHLHYHLMSGPRVFHDQSLPFRFQNIDGAQLHRGRYFDAK